MRFKKANSVSQFRITQKKKGLVIVLRKQFMTVERNLQLNTCINTATVFAESHIIYIRFIYYKNKNKFMFVFVLVYKRMSTNNSKT